MNVYFAARFSRRHECHDIGKKLEARGHVIVSRWTLPKSDHVLPVGMSEQAEDSERQRFATEDLEDIDKGNWFIALTQEPRNNSRGGNHVELGYAIAKHLKITVIGPRENVFHHLPTIEYFNTIEYFLSYYGIFS